MQPASVKQCLAGAFPVDTAVEVRGWVRTRRDSKAGLSFVQLSDGSCQGTLQIVAPNTLPNYADGVQHLTAGASMIARGTLVESRGKGQAFEVKADEIEILGLVDDPETYPIQPKQHSLEFLREVAHLRPRTNTFGAVARIRHTAAFAVHEFFTDEGFVWVNTPIITSSDAEGAGQMFRVSTLDQQNPPKTDKGEIDHTKDFFGREAFLTVSGQLNVEAYCLALSKVYTFGPTFRAENSNTARHLAEFWMIEPEIAFADLSDDADLAERFLKHVFKAVLEQRPDDMEFCEERVQKGVIERLEKFQDAAFERIDYGAAIEILQKSGKKFEYAPEWGIDLQTEHERFLCEEHLGRPVVVMNYPRDIKAFYMRQNDDGKTVAAMDVLAPGIGEIIGGSQREERLDKLDARIAEMKLDAAHYDWYRDLRRYGTVPHAGFGLGFERLLVYICGLANIRDAIPYPRVPGQAGTDAMTALRVFLGLAIFGQLVLVFVLWPELPELVPIHFDAVGCPDNWAPSSGVEWFLIPAIMAVAGIVAGFVLPAVAVRLARKKSPWLNVPDRERFYALPEESRVRAMGAVGDWLGIIGIELQALIAFLVLGTFRVATKQWECLPPVGMYGLLALLLITAIVLAVVSSRTVKREIAKAAA